MGEIKGQSKLPEAPDRWVCGECGELVDPLYAQNPFDPDGTISGCPVCLSVESIVGACWKCDRIATGGYNSDHFEQTGYRYVHSCHEHRPIKV